MGNGDESTADQSHTYRMGTKAFWLALSSVLGATFIWGFTIWIISQQLDKKNWQEVLTTHFAAMIGLPGAAAIAFILVVFLRQTEGPVEFEGFGCKLKGPVAQALLWIISFLAITAAIKWMW